MGELPADFAVGLAGGLSAGLLGVSPGGALVIFSILLLGAEQHIAQGISLIAQIPPSGFSGIRRYRAQGIPCPIAWLAWLGIGFVIGGAGGALAAGATSATALQWTYVAYLVALDALMVIEPRRRRRDGAESLTPARVSPAALVAVGMVAGLSSGFLGIGGGLAITVGLVAALKVPRHQAQLISLMLALVPTTIPAAYVYWHQGWAASWATIAGVVVGLWAGTDLGARAANRIGAGVLRRLSVGLVSAMALYMAYKALG